MSLIPNYPKGSNLTLMDTIYQYPKKDEQTGKWNNDFIILIYKDNETGLKHHHKIESPMYDFYEIKPEYVRSHAQLFIEEEKCKKHSAPYKNLLKNIAELTDNMELYNSNIECGNRYANNILHTHPKIMASDMNIEDFYRFKFDNEYTNDGNIKLSRAYYDIEADTINMDGDFPRLGECPINAVTYIFENQVHTLLLRNDNNPLIQEFEDNLNEDLFLEIKELLYKNIDAKKLKKYELDNLEFHITFYDEDKEIILLRDLYRIINRDKADFLLAWNMAFDTPYIIERIIELGYDPVQVLSSKEFDTPIVKYFIDEMHRNVPEARGDRYTITSYTIHIDQLIQFASRRKGQSKFPDFKLDTIGDMVAGVRKLSYSHITNSIAKLPYLDYKTFVIYNIFDTIVQKCIDALSEDIDYIFKKCNMNNTRYNKGHRQTVYIMNRFVKYIYKDGFICGNNINKNNSKVSFPGAIVGDPNNNSDMYKVIINGIVINLAKNIVDFDFKALYPSIMREFNISPNTQQGKIIIEEQVHSKENPLNYELYDRGGSFLDDMVSGNIVEFCSRWFNYLSIKEFLSFLLYVATVKYSMMNYKYHDHAFTIVEDSKDNMAFSPVDDEVQYAFTIYGDRDIIKENKL